MRLEIMNQAKQRVEDESNALVKHYQEENELAVATAQTAFEAVAFLKTGKKEQSEQAMVLAAKNYQKLQDKMQTRKFNEEAKAAHVI